MNQEDGNPDPILGADIVVIGGGTVGALVTLHLAEKGLSVVCIEAHSKNFGSSQRSAAAARQQFGTPANIAMQVYSIKEFYLNHKSRLGETPPMHHTGYHFLYDGNKKQADGSLTWAPEELFDDVTNRVAKQHANGLSDVSILTPEEISTRFPYIDTDKILFSTFCPTDGFCFPDVITNDGFERAKSLGARLYQNTPCLGFKRNEAGLITGVKTPKGTISCTFVVNATGIWARNIAQMVGSDLPITPVRRYLYFMEPQNGSEPYEEFASKHNLPNPMDNMPFTIVPRGAYIRPDNGCFMLGWDHKPKESSAYPLPNILDREVATREQDSVEPGFWHYQDSSYAEDMCMHEATYLPFLIEACGFKTTTTGFYEVVPDHIPIIDFDPIVSNLVHCAGFSGHGIMQAPGAGRLVTELIIGNGTFVDPYAYSYAGLMKSLRNEPGGRPHEDMVI